MALAFPAPAWGGQGPPARGVQRLRRHVEAPTVADTVIEIASQLVIKKLSTSAEDTGGVLPEGWRKNASALAVVVPCTAAAVHHLDV